MTPQLAHTIDDVRRAVATARAAGNRIGFVPTMGALHEGHLSLIRAARADYPFVVVSVFVNPTQFVAGEDLDAYPHTLDADMAACQTEHVDLVFAPTADEMYPDNPLTTVHVAKLTEPLCGQHRQGHFDGVTTVVAKLLNIVQPDAAYFGQKDAQQAAVIRKMVANLFIPTQIVVCPTVREPDGLAMSSRNAYLSPEQRTQAACLNAALDHAAARIDAGHTDPAELTAQIRHTIESAGPCTIDYISIVDPKTLDALTAITDQALIALAVRIGPARLIDNRLVNPPA